jgi:hypothetical protein
VRSQAEALLKVVHGLISAVKLSVRRTQRELRIETGTEPFCVCFVEGCGTEDYRLLHLRDERQFRGVPGRHTQPSHAAFKVDCHLQLLEEIHSQNSIKLPAAGFRDGG